ncbi:MAG: oligosaccharide flippase family protein [Marmoricola sp.]|nr:oligosaccharide flippase family protein [Marmoricola sp.]
MSQESPGEVAERTGPLDAEPPRRRRGVHRGPTPPPSQSRTALRSVGGNALARMIALPVSALLGIAVTRLLIDEYGRASYAEYALVVGIGALLPFKDLGLGASIVNATAGSPDPRNDEHLRQVLVSVLRMLSVWALVVVLGSLTISLLGLWRPLLGDALAPEGGAFAAASCVALLGVTLFVSVGQRVLLGLGKYAWVVVLNGFQTPIVLLVLLVMVWRHVGTGVYLAVVAYGATLLLAGVAWWMADRRIRPTLSRALRDSVRRDVRGAKVFGTAWPMLLLTVSVALAMQSDRVVLSHVSNIDQLAEYSLAAQMFNPLVGVVATACFALWPIFAKARAQGRPSEVSPYQMAALFGVVALFCALVIAVLSGFLSDVASHGEIHLGIGILAAFAAMVVVQGVKYPLGMYLTDPKGLRFQAYMVAIMLPVNLGISLVLASRFGAVGPVVGSVVGVIVFEIGANTLYIRRRQNPPRRRAAR